MRRQKWKIKSVVCAKKSDINSTIPYNLNYHLMRAPAHTVLAKYFFAPSPSSILSIVSYHISKIISPFSTVVHIICENFLTYQRHKDIREF